MSRSCSQCGNNGHNSRTCPTDSTTVVDNEIAGDKKKGIMLFGVRVTEASSSSSSFRKSVSMNNLSQFDHTPDSNHGEDGGGYASDDVVHASGRNRERKRGTPWTEDEHRLFLTGLHKVGKGDWRGISRNFVKTRTPTQVASHAQKYFLRRTNQNRRRRRSSLFDITPDSIFQQFISEDNQLEGIIEGSSSSKRPIPIPIPIPPSRRMADMNLNKKTPSAEEKMFPLSLNHHHHHHLPRPSSASSSTTSSSEQKTRGSRASGFEAMSSNGDSIMGVA